MKKFLSFCAISLTLLLFTACGETASTEITSESSSSGSYTASTSTSSFSDSSFTNKFGSSDTICVETGCSNPIASSGDTNCCTAHSNRCLECSCYIDGDAMYCMDCLEQSITGSSDSFTNKYGSSTTLCAKSGCSNPIASSGDTNCCTAHSNRCLECSCYIDGDAMYCMSCLEDAVSSSDSSYDYDYDSDYDSDYSDSSSDYDYDMPVEGESFSDYVQRVDPDLYNEMEDILASLG